MTKTAVSKPPLRNLLLELLTPWSLVHFSLALPWLATMPRGDGHPVLLLPGMLADERSMRIVGAFLRSRGYEVLEWGMGRNRGPLPGVFDTVATGIILLVSVVAPDNAEVQEPSVTFPL